VTAHKALSRLARQRAAADAEEGRWLLRTWRASAHLHMGFGSFGEYVERLFGHAPVPDAHVGTTNQPQADVARCHTPTIHDPVHAGGAQDELVDHGRDDIAHTPDAASHAPNAKVEPVHVHARAKQTIPPALRRAVLLRDHDCCRVPGCKNTLYLDLHHIQLRSEGGQHSLQHILSICGIHHRALHRGELSI
jgi:hypothetical protein